MQTFELKKIKDQSTHSFLILSTSYLNPLDDLDELEAKLEGELGEKFCGMILFDLLLSNGNSSNRYIEANFNGKSFDYSSFKIPSTIDKQVKKISTRFYSNNEQFINSDLFSNSFKFLFKKGRA